MGNIRNVGCVIIAAKMSSISWVHGGNQRSLCEHFGLVAVACWRLTLCLVNLNTHWAATTSEDRLTGARRTVPQSRMLRGRCTASLTIRHWGAHVTKQMTEQYVSKPEKTKDIYLLLTLCHLAGDFFFTSEIWKWYWNPFYTSTVSFTHLGHVFYTVVFFFKYTFNSKFNTFSA